MSKPLISLYGKLERRWHVICPRCGVYDIPSGTRALAEETLRSSGWTIIAQRWYCRKCTVAVGI